MENELICSTEPRFTASVVAGLVKQLPDPQSLAFEPLLKRNRSVTSRIFSKLLLERLLVFHSFINIRAENVSTRRK